MAEEKLKESVNSDEVNLPEPEVNEEHQEASVEEPISLEKQLVKAQEEAAFNLDGWQRSKAEFINAKKRLEKQKAEIYVNTTTNLMAKLLPVMDDFERALENIPDTIAEDSWFEGIQLVQRKLIGILDHFNIIPIEAVGQDFDPMLHDALSQEASDEYESGTISRELVRGYKLGDKVIRAALVVVAA